MQIAISTKNDISEIFKLYKQATELQSVKFSEVQWPIFEKELIEKEINEKRQFKLIIDNKIACIWAITFNDPKIWEELDNKDSIYIHRIATNPNFRGQNLVTKIVIWAKEYSLKNHKKFIRMDTCGNNTSLINHYTNCGFNFLGIKKLKDSTGLPSHYHDADVCFFEIKL